MKRIHCIVILFLFGAFMKSQNKNDTSLVNSLNQSTREMILKGNYLKADSFAFAAKKLSEQLNFKKGVFYSLINMGVLYWYQDNFPKAIQYYFDALKIAEELNDKQLMGRALANIGLVFSVQNEPEKALEYYFKALRMKEELKESKGTIRTLSNIGAVYRDMKNLDKAREFYTKSLDKSKNDNDINMIAANLGDLGGIYQAEGDDVKAMENYFAAIKIATEKKDHVLVPELKARVASIYMKQKKYNEAEDHLKSALQMASDFSNIGNQKDINKKLSELYSLQKNWQLSYLHYKNYSELKDTIFNEKKTKDLVRSEMNFDFDKKRTIEKIEQEKKDAISAAELKQQKMQRNYFIGGFILMLIVAGLIFRSYREKQKANEIIAAQKKEVEKQKDIVVSQKHLLEEHQKEIIDSITYAKRIQYALLASENLLQNNLPEHFVLFNPKDVVSGDFYWATPTPDGFLYITADCTGHGVPGAFMSLLNISKLSQTVNENKIYRPDLVLNNVRREIISALNPAGSEECKDGMDAILCKLDVKNMKLQFAAANNSFYVIRKKLADGNEEAQIIHLKADKMPVGKGHDDNITFTHNEFDLQKGDTIYTFSDGYADQFGGAKGKKFKYKQLEDLLISINGENMQKQSDILLKRFNDWKGDLEQVDDVCIIGVRI